MYVCMHTYIHPYTNIHIGHGQVHVCKRTLCCIHEPLVCQVASGSWIQQRVLYQGNIGFFERRFFSKHEAQLLCWNVGGKCNKCLLGIAGRIPLLVPSQATPNKQTHTYISDTRAYACIRSCMHSLTYTPDRKSQERGQKVGNLYSSS